MMDPFEPGPYERMGTAVSDLAHIRRILYAESGEDLMERAQQDSPAPYAFAYGSLRGNLDCAKFLLDRLWGELVGIERALMPEPEEPAEVEW